MKPYNWRGLWNIPTFKGKIQRIINQFSPYDWTEYDWRPTSSLKRWLFAIFMVTFFLIAELGTFYLKFILWVPPPHFLCIGRLIFMWLVGAVAMRESFEYLDNPNCKRMGTQTWVSITIIITEILIVLKFDWETSTKPLPPDVAFWWKVFGTLLLLYTIWNFYVKPLLHWSERRNSRARRLSKELIHMDPVEPEDHKKTT